MHPLTSPSILATVTAFMNHSCDPNTIVAALEPSSRSVEEGGDGLLEEYEVLASRLIGA